MADPHYPDMSGQGATLTLAPPMACFALRCRPDSIGTASAALANGQTSLRLGPDEWWLMAPQTGAALLAADIETALAGVAHSLVDITDRQIGFVLQGPGAATVLQAFCPLDLHDTAFPVGACTRSLLAKAGMMLWRTGTAEYMLAIPRSFAAYAHALLSDEIGALSFD